MNRALGLLRGLVPYLAYGYMTFVGLTTRMRVVGREHRERLRARDQRFIFAFWHETQVFFTWSHRGENASVLVSRSKDGELIARTMELSRIHATRGSSSRGASSALLAMLETVKAGMDLGITPDGPKGPRREVKPGVLFLAQKMGLPILPISNALSLKIVFQRSWDKFQVPLPFGKAAVAYGEPIVVGAGDDLAAKAAELKEGLDRANALAELEVAR